MFWVLLATLVLSYAVSSLLAPKVAGPQPANAGDILPPTAESGKPIPVIFGTQKIAPNVFWWGNVHVDPVTERVSGDIFGITHKTVTLGYNYGADIAGSLCHGPIDELLDIMFQDVSLGDYTARKTNTIQTPWGEWVTLPPFTPTFPIPLPVGTGPSPFSINTPDLFGGTAQGGGVVGAFDFFWGKDPQPQSGALAAASGLGAKLSNYKGLCWIYFHNTVFGNAPQIKPLYVVLRRCPQVVSPDAATANINGSANPADAIYEILTNAKWGLGRSAANFDVASFTASAVTLKAEDMGIDFTINTQDAAETIVGEILRHIDGVLYTHPQTGLLTLKLARADYVVADLPHVTPSNVLKLGEYKRSIWPETFNEVKVNYIRRMGLGPLLIYDFTPNIQQAQNLASVQSMGQVASTTLSFNYFSSADRALKAAFRTLRVVSLPLASAVITVNRSLATKLSMGSVFVLDWPPLGITGMVMRIGNIKFGLLTDNKVELTVVEDVFTTAPATFTPVATTAWVPVDTAPVAPGFALAVPAPYFLVQADNFIGLNMVVRGKKTGLTWDGYFDIPSASDGSPGPLYTTDNPFVPTGTLVAPLLWSSAYQADGIVLNDYMDLDKAYSASTTAFPAGQSLAMIYGGTPGTGEIIAFRDVVRNADGTSTLNGVMRGQLDTLPMNHPIGAKVLFFTAQAFATYWPGFPAAPPTASSQVAGTSGYKGWAATKGIVGRRAPEPPTFPIQQTGLSLTDPRRAVMPYPPGHLMMNGTENNGINVATPIPGTAVSVAWAGRNRLTEAAMRLHSAVGVAEEAGTFYRATALWVNRTTGATIYTLRTDDPVTTPYVYDSTMLEWDFMEANGGVALPGGAANRTNGGLRILIQAYTSATLASINAAVPGFAPAQVGGYPVNPSLVYAAAAVLPTLADVADLYAWYSAGPDGPNTYAGAEPVKTVTQLGDMVGGQNAAITGTVKRLRNVLKRLPVFDFSDVSAPTPANVVVPLQGSLTWFGVIKYSALGAVQTLLDAIATGTALNVVVKADNKLSNRNIASESAALANTWVTVVVHIKKSAASVPGSDPAIGTAVGTLISQAGWAASARVSGGGGASSAIDGNVGTRWSTGGTVIPSGVNQDWFQVDTGASQSFTGVSIDDSSIAGEMPLTGDIQTSPTGAAGTWTTAASWVATDLTGQRIVKTFAAVTARYIKLLATSTPAVSTNWWSIGEFNVYTGASANHASYADGAYTVHRFDDAGSFVLSAGVSADILVVAGGGGGGDGQDRTGGGGGAGGVLRPLAVALAAGSYSVVVGKGGLGGIASGAAATNGANSGFYTNVATGGGHGKGFSTGAATNGGSGGGVQHGADTAGTGIAGQGFAGGNTGGNVGGGSGSYCACGGGGATGAGLNADLSVNGAAGAGGPGFATSISGAAVTYGGGGGGGEANYSVGTPGTSGAGGVGGGGAGGQANAGVAANGVAGTDGLGGGGGGGARAGGNGGAGGRGVVYLRYLTPSGVGNPATIKMRINGVLIFTEDTAGAVTIPGAVGAAVNQTFALLNAAGGSLFKGQLAEQGVYGKHRDGAEATLETYLRSKWGTW